MMPLTHEQFQDALEKGLGRAVQHVRNAPPESVREGLLHASLNCLVYDAQCEESRAPWLVKMFQLAKEVDFYRMPIFNKLLELAENELRTGRDFWQLYELVVEFALNGDEEARNIVYRVFDKMIHDESMDGCDALIRMDGVTGLLYVLRQIGQRILDGFGFQEAKYCIEDAEKSFGKETVQKAIQIEAMNDTCVQTYLDRASSDDPWFDYPFYHSLQTPPDLSLREWVDRILEDDFADFKDYGEDYHPYFCLTGRRSGLNKAARKASSEELSYALNMLLGTTDPRRQFCILGTFIRQPMPRIEQMILDFVDSENESLCWCAVKALSSTSHELIREKAIGLLQSGRPNWYDGIEILEHSFQSGDQDVIEKAVQTNEFPNIHSLHSAGLGVSRLIRFYPNESFRGLSCWFYDRTPCSYCRTSFVEYLVNLGSIPSEILEECRDDCYSEIRELAENHLSTRK